MTSCRTCKFWGPACTLEHGVAWAECRGVNVHWGMTAQHAACALWEERPGEPLGTGLSKWWWHPDLFCAASIVHDLRYDELKPGDSTKEIDQEWHCNALFMSDVWLVDRVKAHRDRYHDIVKYLALKRLADIGYLIIRIYGRSRK